MRGGGQQPQLEVVRKQVEQGEEAGEADCGGGGGGAGDPDHQHSLPSPAHTDYLYFRSIFIFVALYSRSSEQKRLSRTMNDIFVSLFNSEVYFIVALTVERGDLEYFCFFSHNNKQKYKVCIEPN